jgi:DNA mismatch repair protein MutS
LARTAKEQKETPLMGQYNRIKQQYPDAILLFRIGDFYETFGRDAIITADVLGIVLTKRANGAATDMELAGFPHHSVETYLPKLVRAGYRVAICEQLEDPKLAKTIVKRGVTELITPGVALNDKLLDHKQNNFLASLFFGKDAVGVSFLDISTGEFVVAQGSQAYADKLLQNFNPTEIVFAKCQQKQYKEAFGGKSYTYAIDDWVYQGDYTTERLLQQFETQTLKGFGIADLHEAQVAAGAILHYLKETEHSQLQHITYIARIEPDTHVWIDRFTARNLELLHSPHEGGVPLIQVLDHTLTPMGARMLRRWVALPLKDKKAINDRLDAVEFLIKDQDTLLQLEAALRQVGDLERLISKVPMGKVNPREIVQLRRSLSAIPVLKELLQASNNPSLQRIADQLQPCDLIRKKIESTLPDDPPAQLQKGNVIATGVSAELDELRLLLTSGKDYLVQMQQREIERTGIPSLKVAFNNVFGYYLEVRNTHKEKVPDDWIRKQTLVGAERYITPELKVYEEKILGAEEKILVLETQLFTALVAEVGEYIPSIQFNAQLLAQLDCLQSFARVALQQTYRKPVITEDDLLDIKGGRHPVIERQLPVGEPYIPNDVVLDPEQQQIIIITGPNMSGKSALLRQTALIVLLAQMGSFVPAESATIGIVDKVFTRVGASDNLSLGESTFMVEMLETASILNNISHRSLVLLDEIGRGTSTYDGISIAWSLVEFLHSLHEARPKTLFATHYHELTELSEQLPRVKNFHVSTMETGNKVVFLRKLAEGGSKRSFGIHVAKMAGMPASVLKRANEILKDLENKHHLGGDNQQKLKSLPKTDYQLNIFSMDDPRLVKIREILEQVDINTLTPVEALLKLDEMRKML